MCWFYLRTLIPTHSYIRQISNYSTYIGLMEMEHDRSADIGPQRMEHIPNSIPEVYELVRAETPNLSLIELYVKNRAITRWEGPKYTSYNTKDARLRSFIVNDWPHGLNPIPEALSEAGLFFTGKNTHTHSFNKTKLLQCFRSLQSLSHKSVYRFEWSDRLFFLRWRTHGLAGIRWPLDGACEMVSILRLCEIYQRTNFN